MYPGARFYGIKKILLSYSNLPSFLPLPVAIQHGWQRAAHTFESSTNPPEIWVWSPRLANLLEQHYPKKKIRVIGSFFCYLVKMIQKDLPVIPKSGSICIPPHSSHMGKTIYSTEVFAKKLHELDDRFKPIRVMVYYLDMNENVISCYKKYGFEVVTNGELYQDDFLINFIKNTHDKEHCIFGDLGSGVFYSSYLGLKPYHIELPTSIENYGNIHISKQTHEYAIKFDELFLENLEQQRIEDELGLAHILTPAEMRRLLLINYLSTEFIKTFVQRLIKFIIRKISLVK